MKVIMVLLSLLSFSCSNKLMSGGGDQKPKISLKGLKDENPDKNRMESFLNHYKEEFMEQQADKVSLQHQDLIQGIYHFQTKQSGISVVLIFCDSWSDANTVGKTNFSSTENHQKWGTNGGVLFVVKGNDPYAVNDVLGYFSGEE